MITEFGLYEGSSKWFSLKLLGPNGDAIPIDVSRLTLRIVRPDGSVYATYTTDFVTQPDGSVLRLVSIVDNEVSGIWFAVWTYLDVDGNLWVEEMPFVVSKVGS